MGSRLRVNPDKLFEVFVEVGQPQGEDPVILRKFPESYDKQDVLTEIPKFAFPCKSSISQVDQFAFVLTDEEGMFRFIYCRYGTGTLTCLCIMSHLPWFEVFYKMLNFLADIVNRSVNSDPLPFLKAAVNNNVPSPGIPVTIVAEQDMFNFTAPDPAHLPTIPASRNLTEYYNAVDAGNMIRIFASMLYERRIIFTSKKLSRITACMHASESLLYPMHWQHLYIPVLPIHVIDYVTAPMPYLIGIHSSLMEVIEQKKMDIGDAVIIDADKNQVRSQYDDVATLPHNVSSYLTQHLRTHKVQTSMTASGDAVSRAFLQALVRLIGGYRNAFRCHVGEPVRFDQDVFVLLSKSRSTQAFLEQLLQTQIFQQFINGRLQLLNEGDGICDLFEQESIKYKESHSKQTRKLKIKISDMKEMVKVQGKKVISKVREKNETSSSKKPKEKSLQRPNTIVGAGITVSKPARPPPPKLSSRPRPRTMVISDGNTLYRTVILDREEEPHGNNDSNLYQSSSMQNINVVDDDDREPGIRRSVSAETMQRLIGSSVQAEGSDDTSSTSSSEVQSTSFEDLSNIGESDLASSNIPHVSILPNQKDFAAQPSLLQSKGTQSMDRGSKLVGPPVPKPRKLSLSKNSVEDNRGSPMPIPPKRSSQAGTDLMRFESTDNEAEEMDFFDPLSSGKPPSRGFRDTGHSYYHSTRTNLSTGSSFNANPKNVFKRTDTYRHAVIDRPLYPDHFSDNFKQKDVGSKDTVTDMFDPLINTSEPPAPSSTVPENVADSIKDSQNHEEQQQTGSNNSHSLMQDWTFDHLVGRNRPSQVPAGGILRQPVTNFGQPAHSEPAMAAAGPRPVFRLPHPLLQPRHNAGQLNSMYQSGFGIRPSQIDDHWISVRSRENAASKSSSGLNTVPKSLSKTSVAELTQRYNSLNVKGNTQSPSASKTTSPLPSRRQTQGNKWESFE